MKPLQIEPLFLIFTIIDQGYFQDFQQKIGGCLGIGMLKYSVLHIFAVHEQGYFTTRFCVFSETQLMKQFLTAL